MKQRGSWNWVKTEIVVAVHDITIATHGGAEGILNLGAVEAALARPKHLCSYTNPDMADLAASYGYGLARSHGFADGNKRVSWIVTRLFIADNGGILEYQDKTAVFLMVDVAGGTITEPQFSEWIRTHLKTA
jgi:death-on-curing protein